MLTAATDYRPKILRSLGQLPPFSPVLNKLLASLATDDVSFSQLAELIEKDTVMSGNVLRLVNSAAYARRGSINSVPHAISVLGLAKLRNLVLGLSISRMWSNVKWPPFWSQKNFNLHSVGVAVLADHVAQHAPVNYPEGAFVAGLLHDFGKLLMAAAIPAELQEVMDRRAATGAPLVDVEREVIGVTHAYFSGVALGEWNLPAPIRKAAEFHHEPQANPDYVAEKAGFEWHLAELLQMVNAQINANGFSVYPAPAAEPAAPDAEPFPLLAPVADLAMRQTISESFQREFEAIRAFF